MHSRHMESICIKNVCAPTANMPERLSSLISVTRPSEQSIVSMATRIKGQFPATSLTFKCPFVTFPVVTIWSLLERKNLTSVLVYCCVEPPHTMLNFFKFNIKFNYILSVYLGLLVKLSLQYRSALYCAGRHQITCYLC